MLHSTAGFQREYWRIKTLTILHCFSQDCQTALPVQLRDALVQTVFHSWGCKFARKTPRLLIAQTKMQYL